MTALYQNKNNINLFLCKHKQKALKYEEMKQVYIIGLL